MSETTLITTCKKVRYNEYKQLQDMQTQVQVAFQSTSLRRSVVDSVHESLGMAWRRRAFLLLSVCMWTSYENTLLICLVKDN